METPSSSCKDCHSQTKLGGPACWTSEELLKSPFWGMRLTETELQELHEALTIAEPLVEWSEKKESDVAAVPLNVSKEIFPLNALARRLADVSEELEHGKGVVMIENIPVDRYSLDQLGIIYLGMSCYIGHVVLQSSSGLRSKSRGFSMPLGFIRAEMTGKTPLNGKQANNYFRLHTDRCDVISLLSIRTASRGGQARVASAVAIHDAMVERAPHLVPKLYEPVPRIWEGGSGVISLPVWDTLADGRFTTQISPSYIENAQHVNGVARLDGETIEAIDLVEEIGLELGHSFVQTPGMLTFLNNHMVYHGRTAWKHESDAEGRDGLNNGRLLLRTWISPFNSRALPSEGAHAESYRVMWGDVRAGAARGGLEPALAAGITQKAPELVEAYASGKAQYYGMYKRSYEGEDVLGDFVGGSVSTGMIGGVGEVGVEGGGGMEERTNTLASLLSHKTGAV
uniref:TauD/TfdA-like domain-containing protein n=1 Tax=Chromera velia CCMP2878 TaxID=1169474 RepID=A0A0G4FSA5_9ALVE|eukprot:Cvel_18374.t1-p1 / transcript=Cvel_18374.t1 / gene=Cvel_18374 / organism=Chromera_velia_CCMP2878 / gene_product=hypothetical protein / transcript_product=hypothetical protein / location=Cvel_scaffold1519:2146-5342(+) / protein_length=454 / sequence_SO=supercontig / SO=protein_coding / is_pseudo=false